MADVKESFKPGVYKHSNGGVIVAIDAVQARVCVREGFDYVGDVSSYKKSQAAKPAEIVKEPSSKTDK
jgi:hypothetical protein